MEHYYHLIVKAEQFCSPLDERLAAGSGQKLILVHVVLKCTITTMNTIADIRQSNCSQVLLSIAFYFVEAVDVNADA